MLFISKLSLNMLVYFLINSIKEVWIYICLHLEQYEYKQLLFFYNCDSEFGTSNYYKHSQEEKYSTEVIQACEVVKKRVLTPGHQRVAFQIGIFHLQRYLLEKESDDVHRQHKKRPKEKKRQQKEIAGKNQHDMSTYSVTTCKFSVFLVSSSKA